MTQHDLLYFVAGLFMVFAFGLCVQMRMLAGVALKRAAKAKFDGLDERSARIGVVQAVNGGTALETAGIEGEVAQHLAGEYPQAISHIRFARKGTMLFAVLLIAVIAAWRFTGGAG
ncbi:hypothetical protein [Henriciella pelagia]|uniref:Uncharacterized protein n=1 Tax=Henriciella pelagia TaxID=1977912 RepID=A0ABQ1JPP8_9PROT|nr:hypothetical protein [Henriciella pelagia]GGB72466.1 hypothetical protein GCM10011503_21410 [Henriciella pelagia]